MRWLSNLFFLLIRKGQVKHHMEYNAGRSAGHFQGSMPAPLFLSEPTPPELSVFPEPFIIICFVSILQFLLKAKGGSPTKGERLYKGGGGGFSAKFLPESNRLKVAGHNTGSINKSSCAELQDTEFTGKSKLTFTL